MGGKAIKKCLLLFLLKKKDVLLTDSHISLHGQVQQINQNI